MMEITIFDLPNWKEWFEGLKDLESEFTKFVNEHFWELI